MERRIGCVADLALGRATTRVICSSINLEMGLGNSCYCARYQMPAVETPLSDFRWDDLIDCLLEGRRNVVPIIGSELLDLQSDPEYGKVGLADLLAERCRPILVEKLERFGINSGKIPYGASLEKLRQVERAASRESVEFDRHVDFSQILQTEQRELLKSLGEDLLPPSLKLLADMREEFPLILCTTPDDLVSRHLGLSPNQILATNLDHPVDLPDDWSPHPSQGASSPPTKLFHLFGRIEGGRAPALHYEDCLEYLCHLHHNGRPGRLLSHLGSCQLLFLGQRLPEYLILMFVRLLRGDRLMREGKDKLEAFVESDLSHDAPFVGFLKQYWARTRIYSEGGSLRFLQELHRRWSEASEKPTPAKRVDEEEDRPSIFISFANDNRKEALALANALERSQLPVWIDSRELQPGDHFPSKIERQIRRCRLFVPLLSKKAVKLPAEAWFRREWNQVRLMLEDNETELTWVIPVILDDLSPSSSDLRYYFSDLHVMWLDAEELQRTGKLEDAVFNLFRERFQAAERAAK